MSNATNVNGVPIEDRIKALRDALKPKNGTGWAGSQTPVWEPLPYKLQLAMPCEAGASKHRVPKPELGNQSNSFCAGLPLAMAVKVFHRCLLCSKCSLCSCVQSIFYLKINC
jgi:hypothetical protein